MTRLLLDTDCVIDHLKGVQSTTDFLGELSEQGAMLCTNAVVLAELYAGLYPDDQSRAEIFLATLEYLPLSPVSARQAGKWRYSYRRQGHSLSLTDCLIAATALEHGALVVTGNVRHFPMPEVPVLPLPRVQGSEPR